MRVREVLACCFRSVSPGCRRLLPLPLPPALAEPRSTPVAASTSLRNSGSRQSANRTRRSESARAQPERLSPEPRPRPDTAPPGSPVTGGAGHAGCCSGLRAMQRGSTARTGRGAAGGPGARPAASSEPADRKAAEVSGWGQGHLQAAPGLRAGLPPQAPDCGFRPACRTGRPLCWSAGHLATPAPAGPLSLLPPQASRKVPHRNDAPSPRAGGTHGVRSQGPKSAPQRPGSAPLPASASAQPRHGCAALKGPLGTQELRGWSAEPAPPTHPAPAPTGGPWPGWGQGTSSTGSSHAPTDGQAAPS